MDDNSVLQFADQSVTFEKFVDLLATKVALRMHQVEKGQMEISQAEAYRLFGRADVERWKKVASCNLAEYLQAKSDINSLTYRSWQVYSKTSFCNHTQHAKGTQIRPTAIPEFLLYEACPVDSLLSNKPLIHLS